jgi:hypothetical protein
MAPGWGDGATALAAVAVGGFGAFAYYGDTILRPFAHTFGIWILFVAVSSARQSMLRGTVRGGLGLMVSVVAFFYGKQIYYDILYPGPGYPYRVLPTELLFWGALGLVGGAVLGMVASRIGPPGWLPAAAGALLMGLLLADAYHWYDAWDQDLPIAFALVGIIVVGALGHRSWRQVGGTAVLLIPGTIVGYLVTSVPDWAQAYLRL